MKQMFFGFLRTFQKKDFQKTEVKSIKNQWIPAFAGMTKRRDNKFVFLFSRQPFWLVHSWIPAKAGMMNEDHGFTGAFR